ncbi:DUF4259 domain-containing protein [Streptomyces sp. NPDC002769]|uniref:DUF4259 domain-containing protein n=1 Tax=Streptomyces sp. NPDC002769 TaxID=3154542 RepID=UPI003320DCEC
MSVPDARIRTTLRKEISMGTWDIGPFGDDSAADFANALDDAGPEACEALIRGVLVRTVGATGYLREAVEVVAAAALIAAQCPGGQPVVDTPYGPETPMPCSLPTFGRSLTKPSPSSPATKLGRPRSGSTRRTGSSGRPFSYAFAQRLSRRPLPSLSSTSSHNEASLRTEVEPEPENGLHMVTTSRGVQPAAALPPDCSPTGRYQNYRCWHIHVEKSIPTNRYSSTGRRGRVSRREGRVGKPAMSGGDAVAFAFSHEDLPPGYRVWDLVRSGELEQRARPPAPLAPAPTQACWWRRGRARSIGSSGSSDCPWPYHEGEIA